MKTPSHYLPLYLRAMLSLSASGFIVLYGAKHNFFQALYIPSFYFAMGCSFIIAMILVNYIHFVTMSLDHRISWRDATRHRALAQLFLGVVVPAFLDFFLASIYFHFYGHDMYQTGYMRSDFPLIVAMLVILNFIYFSLYVFNYKIQVASESPAEQSMVQQNNSMAVVKEDIANMDTNPDQQNMMVSPLPDTTGSQIFKLNNEISLVFSEIACCFRIGDSNYLFTFAGKKHLLICPLKKAEKKLTENGFFRINRQMLINREFIKSTHAENGKGVLQIIPVDIVLDKSLTADFFVVNAKKVELFNLWMSLSGNS